MGVGQEENSEIVEVDFNITEIDEETLKISPVKRQPEEGEEAYSEKTPRTVKNKKIQIKQEKNSDNTELDNISVIIDKTKELKNETKKPSEEVTVTEVIPLRDNKEAKCSLISSKKIGLAIGVALLASAIIYLQYGGITSLLFACALVCLGVVMSKKSDISTSEVKAMSTPGSFITESEILKTGEVYSRQSL